MADTDPENLAASASGITPTSELIESSNLENSQPNQVNQEPTHSESTKLDSAEKPEETPGDSRKQKTVTKRTEIKPFTEKLNQVLEN